MAYADATFAIAIVAFVCIPLVFLMRSTPKAASVAAPRAATEPAASHEPAFAA
jgi:hypothetical protein